MTVTVEEAAREALEAIGYGKTEGGRAEGARRFLDHLRACGVVVSKGVGGGSMAGTFQLPPAEAFDSLTTLIRSVIQCNCSEAWVLRGTHDPKYPCFSYNVELQVLRNTFAGMEKQILDLHIELAEIQVAKEAREAELLATIKRLTKKVQR